MKNYYIYVINAFIKKIFYKHYNDILKTYNFLITNIKSIDFESQCNCVENLFNFHFKARILA